MSTITSKRRLQNVEALLEDLKTLQFLFPNAFPPKGVQVRPLKIGIAHDISQAIADAGLEMTPVSIQRVMSFWCSRKFYLKSLVKQEFRVNLNGEEVAPVSDVDKETARSRIQAIKAQRLAAELRQPPVY